ncbi:unnamed protein product [Linum trigynum]|uniref:Uncharacterized protein n=1 Tax=Linum trigynum TaxID=586398 RepID=A0AAV2EEA7_9ROSI
MTITEFLLLLFIVSQVVSTAVGLKVEGASYYDIAAGTTKGGSEPSAGIAVYKVCSYNFCLGSLTLTAFDAAVADGMDIIFLSLSLAYELLSDFLQDPAAIGTFHIMEHGIMVV